MEGASGGVGAAESGGVCKVTVAERWRKLPAGGTTRPVSGFVPILRATG